MNAGTATATEECGQGCVEVERLRADKHDDAGQLGLDPGARVEEDCREAQPLMRRRQAA